MSALRETREFLGMSQSEFARRLGTSRPNISAMENGRRPVSRGLKARVSLLVISEALKNADAGYGQKLREIAEEGLR